MLYSYSIPTVFVPGTTQAKRIRILIESQSQSNTIYNTIQYSPLACIATTATHYSSFFLRCRLFPSPFSQLSSSSAHPPFTFHNTSPIQQKLSTTHRTRDRPNRNLVYYSVYLFRCSLRGEGLRDSTCHAMPQFYTVAALATLPAPATPTTLSLFIFKPFRVDRWRRLCCSCLPSLSSLERIRLTINH